MDHAAWVYNQIPQQKSGITPLEFLIGNHSDHRDLCHCHVWGCPVFVLNAKFARYQEATKMESMLLDGSIPCFSHLHSSLVALVRNLHTGYVRPQYHVVFDDKYETIFNDGMSGEQFDEFCHLLFDSSRD